MKNFKYLKTFENYISPDKLELTDQQIEMLSHMSIEEIQEMLKAIKSEKAHRN